MKKFAVLTAAGVGSRMGQDIPKQFLTVNNKPIIIYTMEAFQNHPDIDGIIVVCLDGWHDILEAYSRQFNIDKLVAIVGGGSTGQESIKNGVMEAKKHLSDDDMIIIHDGNRPMIDSEIISNNIAVCAKYGNAITAIPCTEVIFSIEETNDIQMLDRDKLKRTQTPHSFILNDLLDAFNQAEKNGLTGEVACCSLYYKLGKDIYFSAGSEKNIKLTTKDDMDIFEALLSVKREEWMK